MNLRPPSFYEPYALKAWVEVIIPIISLSTPLGKPRGIHTPLLPAFISQRQADLYEFKARLVYIVSSGLALCYKTNKPKPRVVCFS